MANLIKQLLCFLLALGVYTGRVQAEGDEPVAEDAGGGDPSSCAIENVTQCLDDTQESLELKFPTEGRPSNEIDWVTICSIEADIQNNINSCEAELNECQREYELRSRITSQRFSLFVNCPKDPSEGGLTGCDPAAVGTCLQPIVEAMVGDTASEQHPCRDVEATLLRVEACQNMTSDCEGSDTALQELQERFDHMKGTLTQCASQEQGCPNMAEVMAAVGECQAGANIQPGPEACNVIQGVLNCISDAISDCQNPQLDQMIEQFLQQVTPMAAMCPDGLFYNGKRIGEGANPGGDCGSAPVQAATCLAPTQGMIGEDGDTSNMNCSALDIGSIRACLQPVIDACPAEAGVFAQSIEGLQLMCAPEEAGCSTAITRISICFKEINITEVEPDVDTFDCSGLEGVDMVSVGACVDDVNGQCPAETAYFKTLKDGIIARCATTGSCDGVNEEMKACVAPLGDAIKQMENIECSAFEGLSPDDLLTMQQCMGAIYIKCPQETEDAQRTQQAIEARCNQDVVTEETGDEGGDTAPTEKPMPSKGIVVTSKLIPPYLMENPNATENSSKRELYIGYIPELLDMLAEEADFSYKLQMVQDGKYGSIENGKWVGMIGDVIDGVADIAAAPLTITVLRDEVVDFTYPFMSFEAVAVFQKKDPNEEIQITSLQDLLDNNYQFGITKDSPIDRAMKALPDNKLHTTLLASLSSGDMYAYTETTNEGVERARWNKEYAFILEEPTAQWVLEQPPCDLHMVKTGVYKRQYGLAVQHNSHLRDDLNSAIVKLQLTNQMGELKDKYWGDANNQCASGSAVIEVCSLSIMLLVLFQLMGMFS